MSQAHAGAKATRIILHAYAAGMKPSVDGIISLYWAAASPQHVEGGAY